MRVLMIASGKHQAPMELINPLVQGFAAWREKYRNKMEVFFFYAGRGAGGAILNVNDEVELNQMVNEWPLTPFSDIEIIPIVDGDVALKQFQDTVERMSQMMGS